MKKLFTLTIALIGALSLNAQTIPNGTLESFHPVQIAGTTPTRYTEGFASWYGLDSFAITLANQYLKPDTAAAAYKQQIYNTNTAHVGVAARIVTKIQDTIGITAGCLSNCAPSINIAALLSGTPFLNAVTFSGGTDISTNAHRPSNVGVWIEYTPYNGDTAHIVINVLNTGDSVVGHADSIITATIGTYTYINPKITYSGPYGSGAKKLQVILMSSPLGTGRGKDSSVLWVDDIGYTISTDVNEVNPSQTAVKFGPNPSTGIVYIYSNVAENLSWMVYNAAGQVVVNKVLATNNREDLSYLPSGTYFYNILNSKGEIVQKDKFTIAK